MANNDESYALCGRVFPDPQAFWATGAELWVPLAFSPDDAANRAKRLEEENLPADLVCADLRAPPFPDETMRQRMALHVQDLERVFRQQSCFDVLE